MADFKNAYSTSLRDFCEAKGIEPSELEIKAILAIGTTGGMLHDQAYKQAINEFNRLAQPYEDVVDLIEGNIGNKQTGVWNILFGLHDSTYYIRGTAVKKK